MTRIIKEWIEFLNMGDNHYIGIQMENGVKCKTENYHLASECIEKYEALLNEVVVKSYITNFVSNDNYYHLLIYTEK